MEDEEERAEEAVVAERKLMSRDYLLTLVL